MREIRCRVELREDVERRSPGRLIGVLLRYGEQASDRPEVFKDGALEWDTDGIVLNRQHARKQPIMRVVPTVEGREVRIDAPIPDTVAGRDLAAEVRSGLFRGMSIEFSPIDESMNGSVREVRRAKLVAAGVVDSPSYSGSTVSVRHRTQSEADRRHDLWL